MDPLSGETTLSFLLFLLSSWASTSIGKNLLQDEKILFFKRRIPSLKTWGLFDQGNEQEVTKLVSLFKNAGNHRGVSMCAHVEGVVV